MEENLKTVKQVFKDYNSRSFALSEAKVACVNIYKKTNGLEIKLIVLSSILMKDLIDFEKYLNQRFGFNETNIKMETKAEEADIDKKVQAEWTDIVEYMAYKHPLTKALLKDSSIQIIDNKIIVKLVRKGKEILEARGFEKILSSKLQDLYNKKYVVTYSEEVTDEMIAMYQEQAKELEKQAILSAQKEAEEFAFENSKAKSQESANSNKTGTVNTTSNENTVTTAEINQSSAPTLEEPQETSPIILGRSLKIKEELSKIVDLSVDSGKVLLDGEILNVDSLAQLHVKLLLSKTKQVAL